MTVRPVIRTGAVFFAVLVLLLLFPVSPQAETVVASIPAPDYAAALAWDGSALWCGMYGPSGTTIYQLDPADGTVLDSFTGPGDDSYGLTWDGSALWQLEGYNFDSVFKLDTDGTLLDTIPSITEYMAGLTWDGTYLWEAAYYGPDGWIYQVDPENGLEVHSFAAPAHQPWGLAWDGVNIWCVNDDFSGEEAIIYMLDPADGAILDQFDSPGANPRGLTWDGTYLWVCADNNAGAGRRCYQIDPAGGGTADIALSATVHDYGINATGSPNVWGLTIYNVGDAELTLTGISSDDAHFTVQSLVYPRAVAAGGNQPLNITFESSVPGDFSGTVTVFSDDPDEPEVTVDLTGTAVAPDATISFSASSHEYADTRIEGINRWILEITNLGFADLVISDIGISEPTGPGLAPDPIFNLQSLVYPISVSTFDTLEVAVDFIPPAYDSFSGTLSVSSNHGGGTVSDIPLSGSGKGSYLGKGLPLWWFQGVENVECVAAISDVTGDGVADAVIESYDAGASADEPHLSLIYGNSDTNGRSVSRWGIHPAGGPSNSGGYGDKCLHISPDMDNDGYEEVLLGTAWGGRSAYCIHGEDGSVEWIYDTYTEDGEGGWVYAVAPIPDLNGDGTPDSLVGAGGNNSGASGPRSMYGFDGTSSGIGSYFWRQYANDGINCVAQIGDVNGDTIPDAVAGAGGNFDRDHTVYCVSGASSGVTTPIWTFDAGGDNMSICRHSDVTGDGVSEVIVGAWQDGYASGNIHCVNGATGASPAIWSYHILGPVMRVDSFGDTNGDGINDVAVASWQPYVYNIDGATGDLLWIKNRGDDVWAVTGIPDVNFDGVADVVAGAFTGIVSCHSGVDGNVIWEYDTGSKIFSLRWIDDVNGDSYADVLAGTQMLGGIGGRAYCLTGADLPTYNRSVITLLEPVEEGIRLEVTDTRHTANRGFHVYRRQVDPASLNALDGGTGLAARTGKVPPLAEVLETRRARLTARLDGFTRITKRPVSGTAFMDRQATEGCEYEYVLGVISELGDEVFSEVMTVRR